MSSKSYTYDDFGNVMSKSDFADTYVYGENGYGPNAVTSVSLAGSSVATYDYDSNGNMTSGAGREIPRTSFNKPQQITMGGSTTSFDYDPEHNRIRKKEPGGKQTVYINPRIDADIHYEKESNGATTAHKYYIYAGNDAIALYTKRSDGNNTTNYFHKDPLGSISLITDESEAVVENLSYDPFGKRRNSDWSDDVSGTLTSTVTHHGYTGHEQLDDVGLVHMNARLYDPALGRFMGVDPLDFYDGQSKYEYAKSNPNRYFDPDGERVVFHERRISLTQLGGHVYLELIPDNPSELTRFMSEILGSDFSYFNERSILILSGMDTEGATVLRSIANWESEIKGVRALYRSPFGSYYPSIIIGEGS